MGTLALANEIMQIEAENKRSSISTKFKYSLLSPELRNDKNVIYEMFSIFKNPQNLILIFNDDSNFEST